MKINKIILNNEGMQINFKEGLLTELEGVCVTGCIKSDSLCLAFIEQDGKQLNIKDEDTEFFNVPKEEIKK